MIGRLAAIAAADARIRLRRTSTVVVFLLLSATAYLWVPDPSTGRALMRIGSQRALYNSAAIAMATALLGTLFVGLVGFYVVSNAVKRDAVSRCGSIIAATPVGTGEYVVGKFVGNAAFLAVFFAGYMLVSMAMVAVRGEAPLEPLVFVGQYLLVAPPTILFVSALAILFECVPWLAGRGGDVAYFFLLMGSMAASTAVILSGGGRWIAFLDPTGMGAVLGQIMASLGTTSIAIGAGPFDATRPPLLYTGLSAGHGFLLQRLCSCLVPLPLLLLARAAFHRFDPVRTRSAGRARRGWLAALARAGKPLARPLLVMPPARSLAGAALADAQLTFALQPAWLLALSGLAVAGLAAPPRLRERLVEWKLLSALAVTAAVLAVPFARAALARPAGLPALLVGGAFVAALATALGIVAGTPKAVVVVFLSFWYLIVNDGGRTPALDLAGSYGVATAGVTAAYAAIAAALLLVAWAVQRRRLAR